MQETTLNSLSAASHGYYRIKRNSSEGCQCRPKYKFDNDLETYGNQKNK